MSSAFEMMLPLWESADPTLTPSPGDLVILQVGVEHFCVYRLYGENVLWSSDECRVLERPRSETAKKLTDDLYNALGDIDASHESLSDREVEQIADYLTDMGYRKDQT